MNVLKPEKQKQVFGLLASGAGIRGTERLTGVHRDTITRLRNKCWSRFVRCGRCRKHGEPVHNIDDWMPFYWKHFVSVMSDKYKQRRKTVLCPACIVRTCREQRETHPPECVKHQTEWVVDPQTRQKRKNWQGTFETSKSRDQSLHAGPSRTLIRALSRLRALADKGVLGIADEKTLSALAQLVVEAKKPDKDGNLTKD
jgi:hypothetical protein